MEQHNSAWHISPEQWAHLRQLQEHPQHAGEGDAAANKGYQDLSGLESDILLSCNSRLVEQTQPTVPPLATQTVQPSSVTQSPQRMPQAQVGLPAPVMPPAQAAPTTTSTHPAAPTIAAPTIAAPTIAEPKVNLPMFGAQSASTTTTTPPAAPHVVPTATLAQQGAQEIAPGITLAQVAYHLHQLQQAQQQQQAQQGQQPQVRLQGPQAQPLPAWYVQLVQQGQPIQQPAPGKVISGQGKHATEQMQPAHGAAPEQLLQRAEHTLAPHLQSAEGHAGQQAPQVQQAEQHEQHGHTVPPAHLTLEQYLQQLQQHARQQQEAHHQQQDEGKLQGMSSAQHAQHWHGLHAIAFASPEPQIAIPAQHAQRGHGQHAAAPAGPEVEIGSGHEAHEQAEDVEMETAAHTTIAHFSIEQRAAIICAVAVAAHELHIKPTADLSRPLVRRAHILLQEQGPELWGVAPADTWMSAAHGSESIRKWWRNFYTRGVIVGPNEGVWGIVPKGRRPIII